MHGSNDHDQAGRRGMEYIDKRYMNTGRLGVIPGDGTSARLPTNAFMI